MSIDMRPWNALKPGDVILAPSCSAMEFSGLVDVSGHLMVEGWAAFKGDGPRTFHRYCVYYVRDWQGRAPQVLPKPGEWFHVGEDGVPLLCKSIYSDRICGATHYGDRVDWMYEEIGQQPIVLLSGEPDGYKTVPGPTTRRSAVRQQEEAELLRESKKAKIAIVNQALANAADLRVVAMAEGHARRAEAGRELVEDAAKLLGGLGQGIPTVAEQRAAQGWLHRAWEYLRGARK